MQQDMDWNLLPPAEKARTLVEKGKQAQHEGQDQMAYGYFVQSLNLYRGLEDQPNVVRGLIRLAYLTGWADFGDGLNMIERRQRLGNEALPLARQIGDKALLASALCAFSAGAGSVQANAMLKEAVTLAEECGDKSILAYALSRSANGLALQGDRERGRTLEEKALALYREIDDKAGVAEVLFSLSIWADRPQARAYLEEGLALQRELGAKKQVVEILMRLDGFCEPEELALREAYNLEALELCRQIGSPIWEASRLKSLAEIARLRGDKVRAEELEAESRRVYQEPEVDLEADEAFKEALGSGNMDKMMEAFKRRFKS
jgi:hypothetical protein